MEPDDKVIVGEAFDKVTVRLARLREVRDRAGRTEGARHLSLAITDLENALFRLQAALRD